MRTAPHLFARSRRSGHAQQVESLKRLPVLVLTVLLAVGATLVGASAAHGEDPVLVMDYVTDNVAALDAADATRVQQALADLKEQSDLQLFIVLTDNFSGQPGQKWSDIAAVQSALGSHDVMLAIAVDEGAFGLSVEASLPLTGTQVDQVNTAITQQLKAGSPTDAVVAAANELQIVSAAGPGGSVVLLVVIIGVAVLSVLIWLFRLVTARRRPPRAPARVPPARAGS